MGRLATGLGAIALSALSFAGCGRPSASSSTASSSFHERGRATAESWGQLALTYSKIGLEHPRELAHAARSVDSLALGVLMDPAIGELVPRDTMFNVPDVGDLRGANFDSLIVAAISTGNSTRDSLVSALDQNNPAEAASKALELRMSARKIWEYSIGCVITQDLNEHSKD